MRVGKEEGAARRVSTVLLVLGMLISGGCSGPGSTAGDVILIVIGTLRADHVSLYGYERPTAPVLEAFARLRGLHPVFDPNVPNDPMRQTIMRRIDELYVHRLTAFAEDKRHD